MKPCLLAVRVTCSWTTLSLLQIKYLLELAKGNNPTMEETGTANPLSTTHCKLYGTRLYAHACPLVAIHPFTRQSVPLVCE